MESIQGSLKKWMRESRNFQEHYQKMREEVLQNKEILAIQQENPHLTDQDLERHLMKLYEYQSQSKKCEDCPALNECINLVSGYSPRVHVEGHDIRLTYEMCPRKRLDEEQNQKRSLVSSLYMPRDILEASFKDVEVDDPERYEAIRQAKNYIEHLDTEKAEKGLYLHGPFGVGKTYLLGAIANKLADKGTSSMLIFMPEFVREMKQSIQDQTLNTKIEQFKNVPVLMIDDIGAETMSAWFRDEVLGSILQYRMMERLPVFFTSNYNLDELQEHLAYSNRGEVEKLKAGRIIERIGQVSTPVNIGGKNKRK
ncbi:primosomal protein DnaI [Pontibacillus halophilus JSM 076056 = DSM 19796]|uniref:Primosomal protein DnaI n=1 Tax=Pontibacillus halophilus JSM 076056 = DSM 19796 TaxID=1385510 RepID=A0A0A5GN38_9BACI|nr:primosomal protein DnaI [Pontibacillus halophilus]KGX93399.1 primosomal protein DnaI [Pontibacillus halophilus JSM 076056 = DSM 19796]